MNHQRFQKLLRDFANKRILVIGDLILDEFVWGRVSRISPEAPVPIVEVDRETYYPGGAANVARNLREFTPQVALLGLIGQDLHGEKLKQLLAEEGIDLTAIQQDTDYQTIVKTRIIARQQQVVRVDREKKKSLTTAQRQNALQQLEAMLPQLDAIIIEDYAKGLIEQEFADAIAALAQRNHTRLAVDPNPSNMLEWQGATVMKPNRPEAFAAAGRSFIEPTEPVARDPHLLEVGGLLMKKWRSENLLMTLGEHGMLLFQRDQVPYHTPTRAQEVFDVSGAGDTAIALFTLALCAGATPPEAAEISNHASGIVVGKLGTAIVTSAELSQSFENDTHA